MAETIVSLDTIRAKARQAATQFTDVNDACPYPFATAAGQAFKKAFAQEVEALTNRKGAQPSNQESE